MAKKKVRNPRGLGRLYKRTADGQECPATSKKAGIFWLEYKIDGKRRRQALEINNIPVTDIETAKAEQLRIRAPFLAENKLEQLKKIQSDIDEVKQEQADAIDAANPPLAIAKAWKTFSKSHTRPDCGARTLKDYEGHFKVFINWLNAQENAPVYLREITPAIVQAFAEYLIESKLSPNSFNKYIGFLRMFFQVLKEPARIQVNPFENIKRIKQKSQSRRGLTIAELYKILDSARGDLALLLGVGTFTGMRLGDCCCLQWGEIDLIRGIIKRIPNKTASRNGEPVIIGIPAPLFKKLDEIPQAQRSGYLLPRYAELYNYLNKNGQPTRRCLITTQIQKHFIACGIQIHKDGTGKYIDQDGEEKNYEKRAVVAVGFHSLRHTWVSLHAMKGTPQAIIQKAAGHSNPAMTEYYTHTDEDVARNAATALNLPELTPAIDTEALPENQSDILRREIAELLASKGTNELKAVKAFIINKL